MLVLQGYLHDVHAQQSLDQEILKLMGWIERETCILRLAMPSNGLPRLGVCHGLQCHARDAFNTADDELVTGNSEGVHTTRARSYNTIIETWPSARAEKP